MGVLGGELLAVAANDGWDIYLSGFLLWLMN